MQEWGQLRVWVCKGCAGFVLVLGVLGVALVRALPGVGALRFSHSWV